MTATIESLETRKLLAVTGTPLKIGGDGFDMGRRIAATPDGGYVVAGLFSGSVDFDYSAASVVLTSASDTDIYVAKYDASSALVWVKQFGGTAREDGIKDQDEIIDIAADPQRAGGPFLFGWGTQPRNAGEYVNDLKVGADGRIYVVGSFTGSVDFNPGPGQNIVKTFDDEYHDAFVLKLQPNGGLHWVKQFGDRFTDLASSVAIDAQNNVFVTGVFTRDVNFVPGNPSFARTARGRADGYVMKLSASGTPQWVNAFGGEAIDQPERDAGNDLALDSAGNVYVVGTFVGDDVDFDPSPTRVKILESLGDTDGFLAKYDTNGRLRYAESTGGENYDGITNVAVDSRGTIVFVGYFDGEEFDAELGAGRTLMDATPKEPGDDPEFTDLFYVKLARGGNVIQQVRGTGTEFVDDLVIDGDDNVLLAGSFYGTTTFGSASVSSVRGADDFDDDENDNDREESYDAFLWKITPGNATEWVRTFGGNQDDFGSGVGLAADGSILFTGRFRGLVDFDPNPSVLNRLRGFGFADSFVTVFDENGAILS